MDPYSDIHMTSKEEKTPIENNNKTDSISFPDLENTIFSVDTEIDEKIGEEFPLLDLSKIFFEIQFITPKICDLACKSYFSSKNKNKNLLKAIINEHGLFNQEKNLQLALFYYYISAFYDKEPLAFYYLYHLHFYNKILSYSEYETVSSYKISNLNSNEFTEKNEIPIPIIKNNIIRKKSSFNFKKPTLFYSSLDSLFTDNIEKVVCKFNTIDQTEIDFATSRLGLENCNDISSLVKKFVNSFYNKRNRDYEIYFLICSVVFLPPSTLYFKDYYKSINPIYTAALHLDLEDKELEKCTRLINKVHKIKSTSDIIFSTQIDFSNSKLSPEEFYLSILPFNEYEAYFIKTVFEFTFHNLDSDVHKPCFYFNNQAYIDKSSLENVEIVKLINPSKEHKQSNFVASFNYNHYQKLEFLYKCEKNAHALAHLAFLNGSSYYSFFNNNNFLNNINNIVSTEIIKDNYHFNISLKYYEELKCNFPTIWMRFINENAFVCFNINDLEQSTALAEMGVEVSNDKSFMALYDLYLMQIDKTQVFEGLIEKADKLAELLISDITSGGIYSVYDLFTLKRILTKHYNTNLSEAYDCEKELIDLLTLKKENKIIWPISEFNTDTKAEYSFSLGYSIYWRASEQIKEYLKDLYLAEITEKELDKEKEKIQREYFNNASNNTKFIKKHSYRNENTKSKSFKNDVILNDNNNMIIESNHFSSKMIEKEFTAFDPNSPSKLNSINSNNPNFSAQNNRQLFNFKSTSECIMVKNDNNNLNLCQSNSSSIFNNDCNINSYNNKTALYQKIREVNEITKSIEKKEITSQSNLNSSSKVNNSLNNNSLTPKFFSESSCSPEMKSNSINNSLLKNNHGILRLQNNNNEFIKTYPEFSISSNTNSCVNENSNLNAITNINCNANVLKQNSNFQFNTSLFNDHNINNTNNTNNNSNFDDKNKIFLSSKSYTSESNPLINNEPNYTVVSHHNNNNDFMNDLHLEEEQNSMSDLDQIGNNNNIDENSLQEEDDEDDDVTNPSDLEIYHTVSVSSISSGSLLNVNEITNYTKIKGVDSRLKHNTNRFRSANNIDNNLNLVGRSSLSGTLAFSNHNSNIESNSPDNLVIKKRLFSNKFLHGKNPYSSNTSNKQLFLNASKMNKLISEKKRLEELKAKLISKFNQCIDLFNESNQISKNFSYRRFILSFIYKTYNKISQLKPNSESCKKLLARSAEDFYMIFKQSLKSSHLEHLSSSFLYQLGMIMINGIGMKSKQEDQGLGYLQLGKYSSFKFLGNGSILCYFRKYKIDKILNKNKRLLEIKSELDLLKLSKGIELNAEPKLYMFYNQIEISNNNCNLNEKKLGVENKEVKNSVENGNSNTNKKTPDQVLKLNNCSQGENADVCDICFTEKKTTVFYPCKHAVCCLSCALKLIYQRSCPLCRGSITLFG